MTVNRVLVNRADWDGPELPGDWLIFNAPRPLCHGGLGRDWTGPFGHGIFYVAVPRDVPEADRPLLRKIANGLDADDAWPVVFTDNTEIERQVMAKLAEYGYSSPDEISSTVAEIATGTLGLPWHEED